MGVVVSRIDFWVPAAKGVQKPLGSSGWCDYTSHMSERTFINLGRNRVRAVNGNIYWSGWDFWIKGYIVLMISAVRLTTSTILTKAVNEAGACKCIHGRLRVPPSPLNATGYWICELGRFTASRLKKESFGGYWKKVAEHIGADSGLPSIEETAKAMGGPNEDFLLIFPFGRAPHLNQGRSNFLSKRKKVKWAN